MGCKCKEDTYKGVRERSDDGEPVLEQVKGFKKVLFVILRVIIGILLSAIVIVALPFFVVYVVFSAAFGKGVTIDFKKLLRHNGRD